MGGLGSGNWPGGAKDVTDDYRWVDVRRWQRDGVLTSGRAFRWCWTRNGETLGSIDVVAQVDHITLSYQHRSGGAEWKDERCSVRLTRTPCRYGGTRRWFMCPEVGCGRRVALLYCRGTFGCRACHGLAYASQRESAGDRAVRKANSIRQRLGWLPGVLNGIGDKPKGMHWSTFERLIAEHNHLWSVC